VLSACCGWLCVTGAARHSPRSCSDDACGLTCSNRSPGTRARPQFPGIFPVVCSRKPRVVGITGKLPLSTSLGNRRKLVLGYPQMMHRSNARACCTAWADGARRVFQRPDCGRCDQDAAQILHWSSAPGPNSHEVVFIFSAVGMLAWDWPFDGRLRVKRRGYRWCVWLDLRCWSLRFSIDV
jgi:hypothetical protein